MATVPQLTVIFRTKAAPMVITGRLIIGKVKMDIDLRIQLALHQRLLQLAKQSFRT